MANTPDSINAADALEHESTHASENDGTPAVQRESETADASVQGRTIMRPYVVGTIAFVLFGALFMVLDLLMVLVGIAMWGGISEVPTGVCFMMGYPLLWLAGLILSIWLLTVRKPKAALLTSLGVFLVGLMTYLLVPLV